MVTLKRTGYSDKCAETMTIVKRDIDDKLIVEELAMS